MYPFAPAPRTLYTTRYVSRRIECRLPGVAGNARCSKTLPPAASHHTLTRSQSQPASQRSDGHRGTGSERMRARGRRPPIQNHRPSQQASRFPSPIELQRRHDEVRYRPVIVTSDSRSLLWFLSTPRRNSTLWVSFPVPILTDQSSPPPTRSGIHLYLANLREANDEHHCHQQAAEAVAGAVTCTST